jgi:hypothetical protein
LFDEGSNGMASVLNSCVKLLAVSLLVGSVQGCVSDPALNKALGLSSVPASKQAYAAKHKKPYKSVHKKLANKRKKAKKTANNQNAVATNGSHANAKYYCEATSQLSKCSNSYSGSCETQTTEGAGAGITKAQAESDALDMCVYYSVRIDAAVRGQEEWRSFDSTYRQKSVQTSSCNITQCWSMKNGIIQR